MWLYRRVFASILVCGFLLVCIFLIRLHLSDEDVDSRKRPAPELLPNVPRFRTSRVCSQRALVLVHSSPEHSSRRQVIRETWAHPTLTLSLDISVTFGVGTAVSEDAQRSLDWEAEIYGDIFQDSTPDNGFKSGSSRILRLLKAARGACEPRPQFFLKTEDDVFMNARLLGELLEAVEADSASNVMWCLEWNRELDRLGNNDTWMVTGTLGPNRAGRPRYCVGTVYLMTGKSLDAILRRHEVHTGRVMLPEGVYVTGILTREARTSLSLLGERSAFVDQQEGVDVGKVAFAYLGDKFEDANDKIWRIIAKENLNSHRRIDVGL